ncbi:MAG TPA: cell division protein FtsL [Limnochorda sp.]
MVAAPLEQFDVRPERPDQQPRQGRRRALRLKPRARLAWIGVCVVLLAWQCIAQQAALFERSLEVARLEAELAELEEEILRLTVEKARLSSLARVEQVARTKLGMVEPGQVHVVHVPPAGSEGMALAALTQAEPRSQPWWERALALLMPGSGVVQAADPLRAEP